MVAGRRLDASHVSARPSVLSASLVPLLRERRMVLLALIGIALTHLVLAWLMRSPGITWGEDDAQYLSLARALRELSYREMWDIAAPCHARYPPGFPLILAAASLFVGWSIDALQLVVALTSTFALVFFFDAVRRLFGVTMAIVGTMLVALNPMTLADAGVLMSEAPFKLFVMIALWALVREREGTRFAVLAGAALIAAALTRSAGVALLAGLFLYWIFNRGRVRALALALCSVLTVGSWLVWTVRAPEPQSQRLYVADISVAGAEERGPESQIARVAIAMAKRLPARAKRLATVMVPYTLAFPTVPGTLVDNLAGLALLLVTGVVGIRLVARASGAAVALLAAYLALMAVWTWEVERFLTPISPFLFLTVLVGACRIAERYGVRAQRVALAALVGFFMLGVVDYGRKQLLDRLGCDRSDPSGSTPCASDSERNFRNIARWVRDSTPADAIVITNKPAAFFVHANRRSVNQLRAMRGDSSTFVSELRRRRVSYAVISSFGTHVREYSRVVARACADFVVVKEFPMHTAVLRLRGAPDEPADNSACRAMEYWKNQRDEPDRP
ncbi:MAG: glycosyltransferase family 39 protein [Gemmatimonas sp.]